MSNSLHVKDFLSPLSGNAAFSVKTKITEYKQLYFDKISKDLLVSCVYNQHYDRWMFFFKYPSEDNDKYPTAIMYDILIEFDPPNKSSKDLASLDDYDIYIFSNSPSFIFTFDYVIKKQIGFPKVLPSNFLSKVATSKAPRVRNTYEIMTVEKTTWICFYHLYKNGYLSKATAQQLIGKETESYFIKNMETQPQKLQELKAMTDMLKAAKVADKNKKLEKSYRKGDDTTNSMGDKTLHKSFNFNSSFRSGLNRINPLNFISHVSKRNTVNTNVFKSNNLFKWR